MPLMYIITRRKKIQNKLSLPLLGLPVNTCYIGASSPMFFIALRSYPGGDKVGHAYKILSSISKADVAKVADSVKSTFSTTSANSLEDTPTKKEMIEVPFTELDKPRAFSLDKYEKAGIIEYAQTGANGANGFPKLTREAALLHDALKTPKPILKNTKETACDNTLDDDAVLIGGTVEVDLDSVVLHASQLHPLVGVRNDDGSVTAFLLGTSEKGNKAGIAGKTSTIVLDSEQNFEGEKKGQFAKPLQPNLTIPQTNFVEDSKITDFIQHPDRIERIYEIKELTNRFEPVPYNTAGLGINELETLYEAKASMENHKYNKDEVD